MPTDFDKPSRPEQVGSSNYKSVLRDPRAVGWIAFLILMIAIGAGTVLFVDNGAPKNAPMRHASGAPGGLR